MKKRKLSRVAWAVVKVESGVPVLAEVYRNKEFALSREQVLRAHMHPENDETGVFEVEL